MEIRLNKPHEKWFFLIALPIAVAMEWAFARTLDWQAYPRSEWVALFDLCIFMPLLYLIAFSSSLSRKARLLRTAGIAGLGLFAARFIVPDANQFVLGELSILRNTLLLFVLLFEGWLVWKIAAAVYRKNANAKQLENEFAMPEFIAKLMVMEANFWKAVWKFLRRK